MQHTCFTQSTVEQDFLGVIPSSKSHLVKHNIISRERLHFRRTDEQDLQVQDAEVRFGEFLETSLAEGPQIVTKRGVETAVMVPIDYWWRLEQFSKPGPAP